MSVAAIAAGCGPGKFSAQNHVAGNVFRYPIPNKPTTMDPGKVQDGDTIDVIQQVYEGLVGWDEKNQVSPRLATWTISPDGKTYTFKIRPDAVFSNGNPVTAADFKWCIERNCNPDLHSQTVADYLDDIVGALDVIKPKDKNAHGMKDIPGLKALDDHTLQIQITKPCPYFLGKLTYPDAYVFDKSVVKDPGKEITDASEMIGTGPFKFDKVDVDTIVTMNANDKYYDGGRPKLDRIERPYVGDAATRLSMYKTGDVDLVPLEREDAMSLKNDPQYKDQLYSLPRAALWYVGINCNMIPALKQVAVRQAISMAIDKDNIINNVLGGFNDRADCIVPPGVFGHRDNLPKLPFDPAGAAKLLAQAGYPGGQGFPELTMYYRDNRPDIRIVAQTIGQDLQKNLNIKVDFKALEWATYLAQNDDKKLPFFHMRWSADYLDAQDFLSMLLSTTGNENKIYYSNPQFDALCAAADSNNDPAQRLKLYGQAEDIVLKELPFIPIYFEKDSELISPRIHGIRNSLFGHLPHSKVYVQ